MRSKFHVKKAVLISYCIHFHRKQIHLPYGPVATRAIRNSNLICDLFDIKYRLTCILSVSPFQSKQNRADYRANKTTDSRYGILGLGYDNDSLGLHVYSLPNTKA